jgi:hypothetical protein
MGQMTTNEVFKGDINNALRQATLQTGVTGKLQVKTKDAAGADGWVDVPDGSLVGPTNASFYAIANQEYRFTDVAGGTVWLS